MMKRKLILALSLVSLFILLGLISITFLVSSPLKPVIEVEAGENVEDSDFYKNPLIFQTLEKYGLSLINLKRLTPNGAIEFQRVGEFPVQFLVNGKTTNSILKIKDSVPPSVSVKDVVVVSGAEVNEEDFLSDIEDETVTNTEVRGLEHYVLKKKAGVYPVEVIVTDDGGNQTSKRSVLYAFNLKKKAQVQLGNKKIKADIFNKEKSKKKVSIMFKDGFDYQSLVQHEGSYSVPVVVSAEGKKLDLELQLLVKDTKAPNILGAEDMQTGLGESVSYRRGVSVVDNSGEKMELVVDASKVNLKKEGSYPVWYSAVDKAGNKAKKEVTLFVLSDKKSHAKELKQYVKETIAAIIEPKMSDFEKLKSVYTFCNQISYNGSSDKKNLIETAYEGFRTKTGDCFTYYAVSRVLLEELGFEESMVKREGGNSSHYWNLVKFEEEWYHFDSCPIAASNGFTPFMVNDEELLAFSEDYETRFPNRKGYYSFKEESYPERAKKSLRDK